MKASKQYSLTGAKSELVEVSFFRGVATEEFPHFPAHGIGAQRTTQRQLDTVWLPGLKVFVDHISQCLCVKGCGVKGVLCEGGVV